jgi:hypothetical protein
MHVSVGAIFSGKIFSAEFHPTGAPEVTECRREKQK